MAQRKRILFFAKCPMNYVLFRPVHEHLLGEKRLEFVFTGKFQGHKDPARVFESFDLRGARLTRSSWARVSRYDVYVSPDFRLASPRSRVKVHMFHGFSIRNFAIQERALRFDRLFLIGPYMKRRFIESGLVSGEDARLVEVGMPKLDALVRGEYSRDAVLIDLGLDPARKTVLFAPTWIKGGCLDVQGLDIVRALGRLPVNTVIKLHDNSYDARKQRVDWTRELPPILTDRQVLVRDVDSNPFLAAADALVSDASSIANEYLLLDRPLVYFRLDDLEKEWPATDRSTWGTNTGRVIDRADELEAAILDELEHPARLGDVRRRAAEDFFYAPGTAAERAADELLEYVGLEAARR